MQTSSSLGVLTNNHVDHSQWYDLSAMAPRALGPFNASIPRLHFETGDLLIKLTWNDTLIIHSEVFAAFSPIFRASISGDRATNFPTDIIRHPVTGNDVALRTLALKRVEGTLVLEGRYPSAYVRDSLDAFSDSSLATQGWPKTLKSGVPATVAHAYQIFFALMYDAELSHEQIADRPYRGQPGAFFPTQEEPVDRQFVDKCVAVCAIAEHWGCLNAIKPHVLAAMQYSPFLWQGVSSDPGYHCLLARKLQLVNLYYDSVRHLACHAVDPNSPISWLDAAELLASGEDDVQAFYLPQFDRIQETLRGLERELHKLCLHRTYYVEEDRPAYAMHNFMHALEFRYNRSENKQAEDRAEYLARSHFQQIFAQELYGQSLCESDQGSLCVNQGGNVHEFYHRIEEVASLASPAASLLERDASHRLAAIFNADPISGPALIEKHLDSIIRQANEAIKRAFREDDGTWIGPGDWASFKRAFYDGTNYGYFTYLAVPEELPWDVEEDVAADPVKGLQHVDLSDASPEWLSVLSAHHREENRRVKEEEEMTAALQGQWYGRTWVKGEGE